MFVVCGCGWVGGDFGFVVDVCSKYGQEPGILVCGYGQTVATNILFKRSTAVNETVTEVIRVV